ncbi:hypothetical protein Sjap_002004 [Stephania japonica]|uniref:Uncharacterized protein n=1 Tax=Stephania japonica TaxID=461633 RepID=A0AAP0PU29_9MAGN
MTFFDELLGLAKGVASESNGVTFTAWSFISWNDSRLVMYHNAEGGPVFAVDATIAIGVPDYYLGLVQVSNPSGGLGQATRPYIGGRSSQLGLAVVSNIPQDYEGGSLLRKLMVKRERGVAKQTISIRDSAILRQGRDELEPSNKRNISERYLCPQLLRDKLPLGELAEKLDNQTRLVSNSL